MIHPMGTSLRVLLRARSDRGDPSDEVGVQLAIVQSKNGDAFEPLSGGAGAIAIDLGWYYLDLDASDCDTPGPLQIVATGPNLLPIEPPTILIVDPATWPLAPHNAVIDAIYTDTQTLIASGGSGPPIEDIKAAVVEALAVDVYPEPGQEAPPTPTTLAYILTWIYKFWRNKQNQTNSLTQIFSDDNLTVDIKAINSFDGTTYQREKFQSGP